MKTLRRTRGLTMMEVLFAIFVMLIGLVGVLAALPTGISSAQWVIFQDASINLSASKFSEIRRDRINPSAIDGSYEPLNGSSGGWHDFAHGPGDTYENFDDIAQYEWKVDETRSTGIGSAAGGPNGYMAPAKGAAQAGLMQVTLAIHRKGTSRSFRFTQFMLPYE